MRKVNSWTIVAAFVLVALLTGLPLQAQSGGTLKVISIAPESAKGLPRGLVLVGTQRLRGVETVAALVRLAYPNPATANGVLGLPDWTDRETFRFDLQLPYSMLSVGNEGVFAADDNLRGMLRGLLAEQFGLRVHNEQRSEGYALVLTPGSQLRPKPSNADCDVRVTPRPQGKEGPEGDAPARSALRPCARQFAAGVIRHERINIPQLATMVGYTAAVNAPVVDRTGLEGYYDVDLKYAAEPRPNGRPSTQPILDALGGLGLTLRAQKIPVEVVVVDAIGRPVGMTTSAR